MKRVYGMGHEIICNSTDCIHHMSPTVCNDFNPRRPISIVGGRCDRYKQKGKREVAGNARTAGKGRECCAAGCSCV